MQKGSLISLKDRGKRRQRSGAHRCDRRRPARGCGEERGPGRQMASILLSDERARCPNMVAEVRAGDRFERPARLVKIQCFYLLSIQVQIFFYKVHLIFPSQILEMVYTSLLILIYQDTLLYHLSHYHIFLQDLVNGLELPTSRS